jgi:hypothetical protein
MNELEQEHSYSRPGEDYFAGRPQLTPEMVAKLKQEAEAARKRQEKEAADLFDRSVVNARRGGATADDLATLIGEAELAYAAVREAAELARTQALDPTLPPEEANHWRSEIDTAQFRSDRLHIALGAKQAQEATEEISRRAAYDRVAKEHAVSRGACG